MSTRMYNRKHLATDHPLIAVVDEQVEGRLIRCEVCRQIVRLELDLWGGTPANQVNPTVLQWLIAALTEIHTGLRHDTR